MRRSGITWFRYLNKLLTGEKIYDSTSGFRLFDKRAIRLCAGYYPDDYPEPESLIVFAKAGLNVKETAVIMAERNGGQSSIRHFASVFYCLKVTLAMLFSSVRKPQLCMLRAQVITIIISVLFLSLVFRLVIKGRLREEYAIVMAIAHRYTGYLFLLAAWVAVIIKHGGRIGSGQPRIYHIHIYYTGLPAAFKPRCLKTAKSK